VHFILNAAPKFKKPVLLTLLFWRQKSRSYSRIIRQLMYQRESSPSLLGHYLAKPASVAHRLKVRSSPGRSSPVCFFNSFIWDGERKVSRNYVNWSNQLLSQQLPHASTPHLPSLQCRRWLMVAPMYYNGTISHEWCEMGIVEC